MTTLALAAAVAIIGLALIYAAVLIERERDAHDNTRRELGVLRIRLRVVIGQRDDAHLVIESLLMPELERAA